jgi:hypothetical protein
MLLERVCNSRYGCNELDLSNPTFSSQQVVNLIANDLHVHLRKAVSEFNTSLEWLSDTGYIKVIVKQLKLYGRNEMSSNEAGA